MADVDVLIREVEIPAVDDHAGLRSVRVQLIWECPTCGQRRGEVFRTISYDGSYDGWRNPCGHVDHYRAVRREALGRP